MPFWAPMQPPRDASKVVKPAPGAAEAIIGMAATPANAVNAPASASVRRGRLERRDPSNMRTPDCGSARPASDCRRVLAPAPHRQWRQGRSRAIGHPPRTLGSAPAAWYQELGDARVVVGRRL